MQATTLSLALILVGTTGVLADDMKMPVNASQLEWAQAPNFVPEGAQIAVLSGDPSKDGPYVIRFRCCRIQDPGPPFPYSRPAHRNASK